MMTMMMMIRKKPTRHTIQSAVHANDDDDDDAVAADDDDDDDDGIWLKRYEHHGKITSSGSCDEILWPDLDHNLICGNCKVLVNHFNSNYLTCDRYCRHIGRTCVAAFEEVNEDCAEAFPITCDQTIG